MKRTKYTPNEIIVFADHAEVVLYNMKNEEISRTMIDLQDIEIVRPYKWMLFCRYVRANFDGTRHKSMHSLLLNPPEGHEVDHIDGNPLNNQRSNMRICTRQQNCWNTRKQTGSTSSKYKGVYRDRTNKKWGANICVNGGRRFLGRYLTEEEAARAYDAKAKELFGEFARLNFEGEQNG